MFRNHYITIAAWIIVYISLWLSRDNLGYYCLIVDVPHFEKIIYRSAAVIFIGFAIVSFAFPFVF